jgi:hypothetical protein
MLLVALIAHRQPTPRPLTTVSPNGATAALPLAPRPPGRRVARRSGNAIAGNLPFAAVLAERRTGKGSHFDRRRLLSYR